MASIVFVQPDGERVRLDADDGQSAMEVAVTNGVPGIDGDCGGACACATCHVYVDGSFRRLLGDRSANETDMLELAADVDDRSRLACQIIIDETLDGLVLHLPASQH